MDRRFDTNNYEFNPDSKNGVYIIHGFSNTTYEVKQLAKFLGHNGYHTIANNLPGHGTSVEQCNKIKYADWLYFTKQNIAKLASQSDRIYVIGCSMGAVLALYAASIFPVNAVVAGAPVFRFNNPFTINFLIPLFSRIIKTKTKKNFQKTLGQRKFYGYKDYPLIALNEMRKMNKNVIKKLKKVTCPSLIIHSKADKMSIIQNVELVFSNITSTNKQKILLEHAHHNLFDANPDQKLIFSKILNFLRNN